MHPLILSARSASLVHIPFVLFIALFLVSTPGQANAERKNYIKGDGFKQGEDATSKKKKKYIHPCAAGTEQVGRHPTEGGTVVLCRQPVQGGYRKQGLATSWYSNGSKHSEGEYFQDKKHGRWAIYDRTGKKKAVEEWQNGKLTKKTKFDQKGNPVDQGDLSKRRAEKTSEDDWRKDVRTKVERKKREKGSGWVKSSGNNKRAKLF